MVITSDNMFIIRIELFLCCVELSFCAFFKLLVYYNVIKVESFAIQDYI